MSRDAESGTGGKVGRFASGKVGTAEIKNTFRKNKYVKEVSLRNKGRHSSYICNSKARSNQSRLISR